MNRILLIDDDTELCSLLIEYLGEEGYAVTAVNDGVRGAEDAVRGDYSLVILDVMLPGLNGLEVLRQVRSQSEVPVLMLTARGEEVDRIVGLELGADDYLPKPFNPRELLARIRAVQRRAERKAGEGPESDTGVVMVADVELDTGDRTVRLGGHLVEVTQAEFGILEMLMRRAGRVVPREEICRQVLGRALTPFDRSIDVHVSSLRKKLGRECQGRERIKNVRGLGYIYLPKR